MKTSLVNAFVAVPIAAMVCACAPSKPATEPLRPVRTVELRYDKAQQTNRYVGTVQSRHEVDQAFRVGGKVVQRKVDVGDTVHEGDVLAVLDDTDYRLAHEAAVQQLAVAKTHAQQAASDRHRLAALKTDGSVSVADDEHAQSGAQSADATAEADERKVELALNRLKYTVLRASQTGTVTSVKLEVGQVVAEGQPVVSIANQREPEVVVDVPEDQLATFRSARYRAYLASAPQDVFEVTLRELSPQAATQTRTYRARLRPATPRPLPLGATATLIVDQPVGDGAVAIVPATALTQSNGQPALWVVRRGADLSATVELLRVAVHGYRNDEALVSGPPAGELVVTAGVQKMAPGLKVALPSTAASASLMSEAKQ